MVFKKQEGQKFWNPENEGDELIGKVVDILDGDYGKQYVINSNGELMRTPSHKVLQNRMIAAKIGTIVKIVRGQEEKSKIKGNKPTIMYDVYFDE